MSHPLLNIVKNQHAGKPVGIYSACTANDIVLKAVLLRAKQDNSLALIEATANQVDQYGGYTGMKPKDFAAFVYRLADEVGLAHNRIVLGGDHLGPLTFVQYDEDKAMEQASELIKQYVLAGFTKIHIDTSMKVASDDPQTRLADEVIARRGAHLAEVAEQAFKQYQTDHPDALHPVYIVGSEVPIPGGTQGEDEGMQVTKVADFKATVATFQSLFSKEAWSYVMGVVVQPGVEEKDAGCTEYDRAKAVDLMAAIKDYPNLVFEGHSTDYQTKHKLRELVEDGVGILKVGPGLTYALREGLFGLAYAEKEVIEPDQQSHFMEVLDQAMVANPGYWKKYYLGDERTIAIKRKFSFSDRCRYYLPLPEVQKAIQTLLDNFKDGVPLHVLSQFLPEQYTHVREGVIKNEPEAILMDHIIHTIDEYLYGTHQREIDE